VLDAAHTNGIDSSLSVCVPLLADDRLLGSIQVAGPIDGFHVAAAIRALYPLATQLSAFLRWSSISPTSQSAGRRLRVTALGSFSLEVNHEDISHGAFTRKRGLELLRRLSSTNHRGLSRDEIIEALWGESPPKSAHQNLRVILHSLKRALEPNLPSGADSSFIASDGEHISLIHDAVDVDVDEFLERHQRCLSLADLGYAKEAIRVGCQAIALYGGSFMEDEEYNDWCVGQRARLCEVYLDLVSLVGGMYEAQGEYERAVQLYQQGLLAEPANESIHRSLMRSFIGAGRPDDAMRQYAVCTESLWSTLGVSPSSETDGIRDSIHLSPAHL
jgi:DNA-binding SARP family transcriptional activator